MTNKQQEDEYLPVGSSSPALLLAPMFRAFAAAAEIVIALQRERVRAAVFGGGVRTTSGPLGDGSSEAFEGQLAILRTAVAVAGGL